MCIPLAGFGAINTRRRVYSPVLMQDKENVQMYIYIIIIICMYRGSGGPRGTQSRFGGMM